MICVLCMHRKLSHDAFTVRAAVVTSKFQFVADGFVRILTVNPDQKRKPDEAAIVDRSAVIIRPLAAVQPQYRAKISLVSRLNYNSRWREAREQTDLFCVPCRPSPLWVMVNESWNRECIVSSIDSAKAGNFPRLPATHPRSANHQIAPTYPSYRANGSLCRFFTVTSCSPSLVVFFHLLPKLPTSLSR